MKTLIMDTSNTYLVLALYENDICLEAIQEIGNRKQSESAIVYLQQMLEKHKLKMLDIDEMIITIGPGSYTGVRVALTIAKTLGVTTDIKIKVVSSLLAFVGKDKAISVLDARSKKIFVGVYENGQQVVEEQLLDIKDFNTFYANYRAYPIVGDSDLVGYEKKEVAIYENIYLVAKEMPYVSNINILVPHYIKDVEAKKIC